MLGKILQVDSKNNYRSNSQRNKVGYYKSDTPASVYSAGDSSTFSKDSILLSNLPWKLKNYKYRKNESVTIEFEFGNFEFSSMIDLSISNSPSRYNLNVREKNDGKLITIDTQFILVLMPTRSNNSSFKYLTTLFQRINSLKISSAYNISEESILYSLWEDIKDQITPELGYITNLVYTFFRKLLSDENKLTPPGDFYCDLQFINFSETKLVSY
ncbi:MAG: hypothetical protein SCALA702_27180 [Melioribacteraceae bacterium]|nr:MAG: hypothetical protein SCALA702_27180 [Melioribacteraceae bacterium]